MLSHGIKTGFSTQYDRQERTKKKFTPFPVKQIGGD